MAVDPRHIAIGVLGACIAFMVRGAVATFPSPASSSSPTDSKKQPASISTPPSAPAKAVVQEIKTPPPQQQKQPEIKVARGMSLSVVRKSGSGSITLLPYTEDSKNVASSPLAATVVMIIAPERRSVRCRAAEADLYYSPEFRDGLELARWSRRLIEGVTAAYEASLAPEVQEEDVQELFPRSTRRAGLPSLYTILGIDPASDVVLHDQTALEAAIMIANKEAEPPVFVSKAAISASLPKEQQLDPLAAHRPMVIAVEPLPDKGSVFYPSFDDMVGAEGVSDVK